MGKNTFRSQIDSPPGGDIDTAVELPRAQSLDGELNPLWRFYCDNVSVLLSAYEDSILVEQVWVVQ